MGPFEGKDLFMQHKWKVKMSCGGELRMLMMQYILLPVSLNMFSNHNA